MYEDYVHLHPIDTSQVNPNWNKTFDFIPTVPYFPGARPYIEFANPFLTPIWYTDWRDETLSWQLTCSFTAHLNPTPTVIVRGPDAVKFLKDSFINNFDKFPIGTSKHGLMCLDNGLLASSGVLMRTAEDAFETFWLSPFLNYAFSLKKYDAVLEDITRDRFLFQMAGPRSLEILEAATGDDLHDIRFCHFRNSSIDGKTVRVLRFGMSGGLGYEVHGNMEDCRALYLKIVEAGNPYGIRLLGQLPYMMNHTPGGFQQFSLHYMPAAFADPGFMAFMTPPSIDADAPDSGRTGGAFQMKLAGSMGEDITRRFATPVDLGLKKVIDFSHEFCGKAALQAAVADQKRTIVTLKWNPQDLCEIYASQWRPGEEPYQPIDEPGILAPLYGPFAAYHDRVLDKDGKEIGMSGGRTASYFHRSMLSLGILDLEYCELGTEVLVLWGDPGRRQMKIRAKVAPFPYNQHIRNEKFDVETIPHPMKK